MQVVLCKASIWLSARRGVCRSGAYIQYASTVASCAVPMHVPCSIKAKDAALGFYYTHNVFFAPPPQFFAGNLDGLAGILAEPHLVANLDFELAHGAVFEHLAVTDGHHLTLVWLFCSGIGEDRQIVV